MVLILFLVIGCTKNAISNFEECAAAGYPVMESYPRQCRVGDITFVEEINEKNYCTEEQKAAEICTLDYNPVCGDNMKTYGNACSACASGEIDSYVEGECNMNIEEAEAIAENSECTEKGTLTGASFYNENTKTFWLDLEMRPEFENELCNPACVVDEVEKTAEINWRCTGALPPE